MITYKGYIDNTEWWTEKDHERHNKIVEELKLSGEYGKEEVNTITIVHNPIFDGPIENYRKDPKYKITEI